MEAQLVEVVSPLHGIVTRVERGPGARVDPDTSVVTVESDNMQVAVEAGLAGVVDEVRAVVGAAVEPGEVLAVVAAYGVGGEEIVDLEAAGGPPSRATVCTHCGSESMEPGFIEDRGQGSRGYGRWVEGHLERGLLGARRMGRRRRAIEAYRCVHCSHLDFFATDVV
jgi:biotin-dependent enzyme